LVQTRRVNAPPKARRQQTAKWVGNFITENVGGGLGLRGKIRSRKAMVKEAGIELRRQGLDESCREVTETANVEKRGERRSKRTQH